MDFLFSALNFLGVLLLVILVFNLMILVHEWGHFLAARWRGLKVEKFYVWFGKPLWKKRINGVEYGLGSIPAGGYVALPQMAPMEAIEGRSEFSREKLPPIKPLDKIIVAFAGPLFSFLLAVFFAGLVWFFGKPEYEIDTTTTIGYVGKDTPAERDGLKLGDKILAIDGKSVRGFRGLVDSVTWHVVSSQGDSIDFLVDRPGQGQIHVPVKAEKPKQEIEISWWKSLFTRPPFRQVGIGPFQNLKAAEFVGEQPNSPAEEGGMKADDVLRTFNGVSVFGIGHLADLLEQNIGKPVTLGVERHGAPLDLTVTPRLPDQRPDGWQVEDNALITLGVAWNIAGNRLASHPSPLSQIKDASRTILQTLRAITSPKGDIGASHLSGFIGIANVYYHLFQDPHAWQRVIWFSVVLNINLAILNLLPFPVLDGGHIVMAILEWIRRRPLNIRVLEVLQTACVLLLLSFMVFVSFKDTGDVFGIGRKKDPAAASVEPKFLPPAERAAARQP